MLGNGITPFPFLFLSIRKWKNLMDITPYLKLTVERDASDIYFTVGSPARLKISGKVINVGKTMLTADMTQAIADNIMNEKQRAFFEKELEIDLAISFDEIQARFRVNAFRQKGFVSLAMRYIKTKVPTLDELKLPVILKDFVLRKRGLILVAGPTNTGKSTTIAAMIEHRNKHRAGHILTIEDPIEFIHSHQKSLINQRELGMDTHSYLRALRSAMRESPDVILIGEIRDRETMTAAVELSNTGHLAISTLHASNANQAMQRIIALFPREQHERLFMDLSLNVISIISQRLVTGVDNRLAAAIEVMINTPYIADLILKGKIEDIKEAMTGSGAEGMQTFDMAMFNLYTEGRISLEEALANADSRTDLQVKIAFGQSAGAFN